MLTAFRIGFWRDADWLTSQRVKAYAIMLGIASLGLIAHAWVDATGTIGTDFLAFWGAAKAVLAGDPASAYDLATQQRIQSITEAHGFIAFVNPPPFLFVVVPFGLLPLAWAWPLWVVATYALWACVTIRAFPRLWLLCLIFPGALIAATHAQNGLLTGALLVGGVTLLDRRPLLAGALFGALIIKPHLALLIPFWLAAGGRWRAFIAAGVSTIGLLALSWLVFGTETMLAYPESWKASQALLADGRPDDFFLRMSTVYAQLRVHATPAIALASAFVIAPLAIVLTMKSWRRFDGDTMASGAVMLAATGIATPYLFNYDLPFLVVPTLWLVQEGLSRGFRPYEKVALIALFLAPYATRAVSLPLELNLMPFALLALIWLIWTRGQRHEAKREMNEALPRPA